LVDTFTVTTTNDVDTNPGNDLTLSEAIAAANSDANGAIINFASSVFTPGNDTYTLTGNLPVISAKVTIDGTTTDGLGIALDAAGHQGLFVSSGIVHLENLLIANAAAAGTAGGTAASSPSSGGGGGGGGGAGLGGGLFVGSSAAVTLSNVSFLNDSAKGGAGGNGSAAISSFGGGGGGAGGGFPGSTGGSGGKGAGGSGLSGIAGDGRQGGFGVGGGGGGHGTVASGSGNSSTFGGGGGGGGAPSIGNNANPNHGGSGGFGGGNGVPGSLSGAGSGGGGGGGLGAGGDIFVEQGGLLTIDSGSLGPGTVTGGTAGKGATGGHGYGSGLFIEGTQSVTFAPAAGHSVTISGVIADMSGSNDPTGLVGDGLLIMNGAGKLVLAADNMPGASSDPEHAGFNGGIGILGGTVDLAAAGAAGSGAITFQDPPAIGRILEFTGANAPTNEIDGFGAGDSIQIDDFRETSLSYSGGFLALTGTDTGNLGESFTLDIPGLTLANFQSHVGSTDTVIDYVACYCLGTLVQTARGQQKVEALKIGDALITASGAARPIKWIGRRSYGGRFIMGRKDILPICIKASALDDNVPNRDLWISPHHAMYFADDHDDGMLIEAKDLINGVSIVQMAHVDKVEYFHIELETHDVIVAEGALSETFIDDDSRAMFHNAHDYAVLYPDAAAQPARYYAPRCEEGYAIETVRRRIALRAGLLRSADAPRIGPLRGYIDNVSSRCIEGWAQNTDNPEAPVCLDIHAGGQWIGQVLANHYRDDLDQAGIGSGCHGFAFTPPAGLELTPKSVDVRRALDGVQLEDSADGGAVTAPRIKVHRKRRG